VLRFHTRSEIRTTCQNRADSSVVYYMATLPAAAAVHDWNTSVVTLGTPVASGPHSTPGGLFVLGVQSRPGDAAHCVALSLATSPTPPSQVGLVMAGVTLTWWCTISLSVKLLGA
jgi:hypothetical protein